jgi:hypothetical protein
LGLGVNAVDFLKIADEISVGLEVPGDECRVNENSLSLTAVDGAI